jgi:hypothetical protein
MQLLRKMLNPSRRRKRNVADLRNLPGFKAVLLFTQAAETEPEALATSVWKGHRSCKLLSVN